MTRPLDRRTLLAGATATAAVAPIMDIKARAQAIAHSCAAATTLGAAAASGGVTFGCSIGVDVLPDKSYVDLILREVRALTTDLAFKLPFIYPERGRFDFAQADRLVAFAQEHKLPLRAHTLFWDLSNPDWVTNLSVAERRYEFDRIIDVIVTRYRGQLYSWDLVNEPFWPGFGEAGGFRRGAWYDALGQDYVFRAFRRAAEIDPGAKMILNCDMTERNDQVGRDVRRSLLLLVDDMLAKGVRLDVVGLQGHVDPGLPYDTSAYEAFLWQLAERKVPIHITELDVLDTTLPKDVTRRDKAVANLYASFLTSVLKIPSVEAIIAWQLADAKSWYRSDWYRSVTPTLTADWRARPLPFDDHLAKKAAWHAMMAAFCARAARPPLRR